jgi:hypothetical protein
MHRFHKTSVLLRNQCTDLFSSDMQHKVTTSKLAEIAALSAGIYLKPSAYGDVACLQVSDFGADGALVHVPAHDLALTERQSRNLLQAGDVLLTTKGTHNRAFLFPEAVAPAVAGSAFIVVRLLATAPVLPAYLAWWLNTEATQAELRLHARGSAITSISKEVIASLAVPIPSLEQQALMLKIQALAERENRIRQEIAQQRNLFTTQLLMDSIKH